MAEYNKRKQAKSKAPEPVVETAVVEEPTPVVEPTPVEEPTPIVEPTPEPVVESKPAPVKQKTKPVSKYTLDILEGDSTLVQHVKTTLKEYLEKMAPGRSHAGKEGAITQVKFLRLIETILKLEGTEFTLMYGTLLDTVNKNKGSAFSESYIYRYFDSLTISPSESAKFSKLMNLLLVTCDPDKRRASLRQVDVMATLETLKNDAITQRVVEFYKL